jgi:hypothetical protein
MNRSATLGCYVYVVGEAMALAGLTGLTGIDDAPVTATVRGRLCGLTSMVSIDAFRTAQQPGAISETGWLAHAVRAHERVALQATERAPVLPMRFGTMYATADEVGAMLQRHETALLTELHRLAGGTEWCLKVSGATGEQYPDVAERYIAAQPVTPASSGTAWLLSRQAALRAREQRGDRLAECVEQLRAEVAHLVRDIAVTRPASGAADAMRMWLLIDDVERFDAAFEAARLRQQAAGFTLELTGPWPPYHFVRTDALRDEPAAERRDDTYTASRDDVQPVQPRGGVLR